MVVDVVVNGVSSRVIHVICSVPQGSVLEPLLFILYSAELADIATQHKTTLHTFADDNQLYIHCQPQVAQSAAANVETVLEPLSTAWLQIDSGTIQTKLS